MSLHSRVVLLSLAYAVTVAQAFVPTVGARDDSHLTNALHSDGVSGFNAFAKDNLAVYYGLQSRGQSTLASLCQEQDADIAILPFVKQFNGLNQVPYFSFTWDCSYNGTGSPAGLNCANFAANITYCQSLGTKVFVSVGGASSNTTFASANDASNAASTLWNIFGAGTATPSLRPFANITVDGFDFDNEGGTSVYYDTLASTLQSLYKQSSGTYYISAAPICANTTAALPYAFYQYANFIWPQFYNTQKCSIGGPYFTSSLTAWYNMLKTVQSQVAAQYPRLYIGGLAFQNYNSNGGYLKPSDFASQIVTASRNITDRYGGVALWNGIDGMANIAPNGADFLNITKVALESSAANSVMPPAAIARLLKMWIHGSLSLARLMNALRNSLGI